MSSMDPVQDEASYRTELYQELFIELKWMTFADRIDYKQELSEDNTARLSGSPRNWACR